MSDCSFVDVHHDHPDQDKSQKMTRTLTGHKYYISTTTDAIKQQQLS